LAIHQWSLCFVALSAEMSDRRLHDVPGPEESSVMHSVAVGEPVRRTSPGSISTKKLTCAIRRETESSMSEVEAFYTTSPLSFRVIVRTCGSAMRRVLLQRR